MKLLYSSIVLMKQVSYDFIIIFKAHLCFWVETKKSCYWSCCLATALHRSSRTRKIVNTPKMNYLAFHTGTNLRTKKYGHFSRPMLTRIYKTSDTYPPFLQNIWWISTNYSQKIKRFHEISVSKVSSYVFTKSQSRISINLCWFIIKTHSRYLEVRNSWNYVWLGSPSDDLYLVIRMFLFQSIQPKLQLKKIISER